MRLLITTCLWTSILLGCPHRSPAQELTGVVHVNGTNAPAAGATVVLIDSAGTIVRGMLTREDGRFTLHASHAGVYRVRARQIGFSPDSSGPFQLDRNGATTVDLSLKHFAAALGGVNVSEKIRCAIAPAAGTLALQLWEDVQSALTATVITESGGHRSDALLTRFTREIDPATGRVLRSTSWQLVGSSSEPYSALPADSLAARGFVVKEGQDVVYYAPDARTLLSDAFARTHCFRPSEDPDHAGLIGLAFTPLRHGNIGQVSGALWLDKTSKELRYLEFVYSSPNSAGGAGTYDSTNASGRIDYERLPQGKWIVNRWLLRVPIVEVREARTISSNGSLGVGATLTPTRIAHLKSLWEIGGEARINTDSSSVASQIDEGSVIQGRIVSGVDSGASEMPINGLRVELSMPGDTAQDGSAMSRAVRSRYTDTDGGFHFDSLPSGNYVMRITSAKLDTLAVMIPDRPIHVNGATRMTVTTTLPTAVTILRDLCGRNLQEDEMVLHGIVRDHKSGQPAIGAIVKAYWYDAINTGRNFSAHQQSAATVTGSDGKYALCTKTPRGTLHLSASLNNRRSPDAQLEPAPDRVRMFDLTIR